MGLELPSPCAGRRQPPRYAMRANWPWVTMRRHGCWDVCATARHPQSHGRQRTRSEEHTSETPVTNTHLVCRLLLEKKKQYKRHKIRRNTHKSQLQIRKQNSTN